MFTGIVAAVGRVSAVDMRNQNERGLTITTPFVDAALGESIAVNGVCLTVANKQVNDTVAELKFFASQETCSRSNLGALETGSHVNLERALKLGDRLSGHLVQGHVDGCAPLRSIRDNGECHELEIELSDNQLRYVIEKGSITLDGISLTVNFIKKNRVFLMIIPHTWQHTTLQSKRVGEDFNVELDMVAKYLEKFSGKS